MKLFAAVPYLELAHENSFQFGPVLFWPVSRFHNHIPVEDHSLFREKIMSHEGIDTCVSIDERIDPLLREHVLLEALYLLYFTCIFRNVFYFNETPPFDLIKTVIRLENNEDWSIRPFERDVNKLLCASQVHDEIVEGLSKAFMNAYITNDQTSLFARRLIRSIRFYIDRFVPRMIPEGIPFSLKKQIYEPEDFLLLSASFESLFDINPSNPPADFKQKLRPLLHLKYSQPLELFWKWADKFYKARYAILHGNLNPAEPFNENPHFILPLITVGSQLLIYSIYYMLFKHQLVSPVEVNPAFPPDFKWIHPEKVLVFFWTEGYLLHKIHFMLQQSKSNVNHSELMPEINFLTRLYIAMRELAHLEKSAGIQFFPSRKEEIQSEIDGILKLSAEVTLPESFINFLK